MILTPEVWMILTPEVCGKNINGQVLGMKGDGNGQGDDDCDVSGEERQ